MKPILRFFLWAVLAFVAFCLFLGAVSANNNHRQANATILWGLLVVSLVILWWCRSWVLSGSSKEGARSVTKALEEFQERTKFNCDRVLVGSTSILFDTQARRMAFHEDGVFTEYPIDYIRNWEHQWSFRGDKTYNHRFDMRLNDLNRPHVTIIPGSGWAAGNKVHADEWDTTLDLILSQK